MKKLLVLLCLFAFVGCSDNRAESVSSSSAFLDEVLDSQTDEMKARYQFRNPKKTLEFFGIERGMTVVEVLPGRKGWYTKLLVPFLGSEGSLVGANYAGIDILIDENNKVWITEINSVPAWKGLESTCNIDIANLLVDDFLEKLEK